MNPTAPARSPFVTIIGWIFLVLSGGGFLVLLMQTLMLHFVFPDDALEQMARMPPPPGMPSAGQWIFGNMAWLFAAMMLQSGVQAVAALGLVRRWAWARRLFIGLMGLAILGTLGGLAFQLAMTVGMHEQFADVGRRAGGPDIGAFFVVVGAFATVMALAFCGLYGWIIKRLMAPAVVAEFGG